MRSNNSLKFIAIPVDWVYLNNFIDYKYLKHFPKDYFTNCQLECWYEIGPGRKIRYESNHRYQLKEVLDIGINMKYSLDHEDYHEHPINKTDKIHIFNMNVSKIISKTDILVSRDIDELKTIEVSRKNFEKLKENGCITIGPAFYHYIKDVILYQKVKNN